MMTGEVMLCFYSLILQKYTPCDVFMLRKGYFLAILLLSLIKNEYLCKKIIMNRGSEWRIWDLHFHTPSSYDYQDKSVKNQDIINALSENNVSVVAITDHHVIDIEQIEDFANSTHKCNFRREGKERK